MGLSLVPNSLLLVQEEIVIANKQINMCFITLALTLAPAGNNVIEHVLTTLTVSDLISPLI